MLINLDGVLKESKWSQGENEESKDHQDYVEKEGYEDQLGRDFKKLKMATMIKHTNNSDNIFNLKLRN